MLREGVDSGLFSCPDPHGAAWRLGALLDGLGVQASVHEGLVSSAELLTWVRTAARIELHLPGDAFAHPAPMRRPRKSRSRSRAVAVVA